MPHLIATVTELGERGVGFRSLPEAIDTTTAPGRLLFGILASIAAFERDNQAECVASRSGVPTRPYALSRLPPVKQGLGKAVPVVGVVAGLSLNWLTIEQIADAADVAYRRRFLLEKYLQLAQYAIEPPLRDEIAAEGDDPSIAVLDLLREAGVNIEDIDDGGNSQS